MERNPKKVLVCGTTQGPSWGYLKVNFSETLSIFGEKRPRNGSKNGEMAPRTGTGYPHIGPFVVAGLGGGRDGLPAAPILAYLGSGAPDSQNTQTPQQLHFMIGILVHIQNAPVLNDF